MPIVFVLWVIGAFAVESRAFDIVIMVVFGILGYALQEMDYPVAPLVLGIILGDFLDKNLRRALVLTDGDLVPFFTRPISLVLILFILLSLVGKTRWFSRLTTMLKHGILSLVKGRKS
jgi:putative tricarboxylic transport membrane protein